MKERLIGAAVLAALAVWLIPWLLDGPDEQIVRDGSTLELPVPSGHVGEIRTEVIDLSPHRDADGSPAAAGNRVTDGSSAHSSDAGGTTLTPIPPPASSAGTASNTSTADSDAPSAGSAAPTESAGVPEADASAGDSARAASETSAAQAETRSTAASAPSGATAAARETETSAPSSRSQTSGQATAAAGDWAVQLGSFGDEENARRLAERVEAYGHAPRISTYRAGGRPMYRVRIGPHATRDQAEAAASALAAHGFVAQVVTN